MRILVFVSVLALVWACKNDPSASNAAAPVAADSTGQTQALPDSLSPLVALDGQAFEELLSKNRNIPLFDLRSPEAYKKGHIHQSISLPFDTTGGQFAARFNTLDRSMPIAFYCNNGYQSKQAAQVLFEMQYQKVYILKDGILSWITAGKTFVTF